MSTNDVNLFKLISDKLTKCPIKQWLLKTFFSLKWEVVELCGEMSYFWIEIIIHIN